MQKGLVIAKFNEDLSWIELLREFEVTVYSKLAGERNPSYKILLNIGRESHTYLHHIVTNYNCMPDLCVFCQGNPFDHCPDFVERISRLIPKLGYVALSSNEALFDAYAYPQLSNSPLSLAGLCFAEYFETVLGHKAPALFYARMNGLFAVDRETIQRRPLSFYQRCLTLLQGATEEQSLKLLDLNSVDGHFFERLWHFIFNPDWHLASEHSLIYGMPPDRLKLVLPMLEKWPEEVRSKGALQASSILLAASEILNQTPSLR